MLKVMEMYREFLAPSDEDVFEAIGEWPESDESGASVLAWYDHDGGSLVLSYDVLARSVRVRWTNGRGDELLDVYRESATRLAFGRTQVATHAIVEFHMGECAGTMEIQVAPSLSVRDRLLYQ